MRGEEKYRLDNLSGNGKKILKRSSCNRMSGWIKDFQDKFQGRDLLIMVINIRFPQEIISFLSERATISFSSKIISCNQSHLFILKLSYFICNSISQRKTEHGTTATWLNLCTEWISLSFNYVYIAVAVRRTSIIQSHDATGSPPSPGIYHVMLCHVMSWVLLRVAAYWFVCLDVTV
jgi:hypothetical protein